MRSLFRSFESRKVEYLLISGQASILYGAATFSEDIDIWARPDPTNLGRLLSCLASGRALVHKLTPPLTLRHARQGHGFHFVLPASPLPVYLDVMARPPRVGSFGASARRARDFRTDWGTIPVVAIEDLVALKMTRRLSDYEVISNLVQVRLAEIESPSRDQLRWAALHSFRAEDRVSILGRLGRRANVESCRRSIAREVAAHQARDVRYWKPRLEVLRALRRSGRLWPEGRPLASLLR